QASSSEGGAGGGSSPTTEEPALAFPVTEEQRRELRKAFELFDRDGSGLMDTLSAFSFRQVTVKALGCELRKEEMRRIVSEFSEEGSGKLNFKSFLQVMTQKMAEPCSGKEIRKAFRVFDCDGTGKISFENLKVVACEVGEDITDEELQEMIDEADVDGDGEVNRQEFLRILTLTD
ncbi:CETN1 protein, partial [Glareola pratincola]|nr:CETN1 protein [Glareola pratincola]